MIKQLVLIGVTALFAGCVQKAASPSQNMSQSTVSKPVRVEAQAELARLNEQCAHEPWRGEVEMIERPETRPANRVVSGEVSAFVADAKKRIGAFGLRVKWNDAKKAYEIEEAQPGVGR